MFPAALARTSLVLQRLEPPPGLRSAWGFPPHPPGRSVTCTTRKLLGAISRMRGGHQRYGGTVMFFPDLSHQVMLCAMSGMSESSGSSGSVRAPSASRVITLLQSAWGNCFSLTPPLLPGVSRSCLARPSAVGTAAGIEKCMGLPAPSPGQVNYLHRAETTGVSVGR